MRVLDKPMMQRRMQADADMMRSAYGKTPPLPRQNVKPPRPMSAR
jgi:hypothetical protein